jgi:hypothetical protein
MLRRSLFPHWPALNFARLLPFRKPAPSSQINASPRFQFTPAGQLMHSPDGGRTWIEALAIEPGYHSLNLWQRGAVTHLRLDYADRSVEWLSTNGSEWHAE